MNPHTEQLSPSSSPRALVFGASGAIGIQVCGQLLACGWRVVAITRQPISQSGDGIEWRHGELPYFESANEHFDAVISCGPLSLFSEWLTQTAVSCNRVVAFSSTSVHVKQSSPDLAERELMERLLQAEAQLAHLSQMRSLVVTILRPTLIYGSGKDRNISRIAALAKRYGFFILPHDALGLRQPVHAADLAKAAIAALGRNETGVRSYDLAGGETLSYREMTERVVTAMQPPARLIILPGFLFQTIAKMARVLGMHDAGVAVLARMRENLVFDDSAARAELGYDPRPFDLDSSMLNLGGNGR
jgi:nucleoside-diphosphate-sugar epimerase